MSQVVRHPTQYMILDQLRRASTGLRYRDMKPADMESDLYNYHLQYLVKHGYVAKTDGLYYLDVSAKKYLIELGQLDEQLGRRNFKMASLCVVTREGESGLELLYQTRGRQPMAGQKGLVGGGIQRGELATQAAARVAKQKAGLDADFRLLGVMRKLRFDNDNQLYMDILYHLCLAAGHTGELAVNNEYGQQFWAPLDEAIRIEREETMGSSQLADILEQFRATSPAKIPLFYIEETYHHDIF